MGITAATRRLMCTDRWASLSPVNSFVRNFAPSRKRTRDSKLDEEFERPIFDELVQNARTYNKRRVEGQPPALLGCLSVRHYGAGTVRNGGQFALLVWTMHDGEWCPSVILTHFQGHEVFILDLPPEDRREGRNAKAAAWLHMHYSPAYRQHLADLRQKVVERNARRTT